jgi:uncharacterized protein (TIGR00730 family)
LVPYSNSYHASIANFSLKKKKKSDAFIALPGGFGTMEELLEVITWSQLNIHSKPIILLNTNNYYDLFAQWINHCADGKQCHNLQKLNRIDRLSLSIL